MSCTKDQKASVGKIFYFCGACVSVQRIFSTFSVCVTVNRDTTYYWHVRKFEERGGVCNVHVKEHKYNSSKKSKEKCSVILCVIFQPLYLIQEAKFPTTTCCT